MQRRDIAQARVPGSCPGFSSCSGALGIRSQRTTGRLGCSQKFASPQVSRSSSPAAPGLQSVSGMRSLRGAGLSAASLWIPFLSHASRLLRPKARSSHLRSAHAAPLPPPPLPRFLSGSSSHRSPSLSLPSTPQGSGNSVAFLRNSRSLAPALTVGTRYSWWMLSGLADTRLAQFTKAAGPQGGGEGGLLGQC